jgi:peptidoglycan hydrolase CwlO-like protein
MPFVDLAAEQARLAEYDRKIKEAEAEKIKAETSIEQLKKQLEEIDKQLSDMGIPPEKAQDELKNLEQEIVELREQAGRIISEAEELRKNSAEGASA